MDPGHLTVPGSFRFHPPRPVPRLASVPSAPKLPPMFRSWCLFLGLALLATGCASRPAPKPVGPPKPILRVQQATNGSVALQVAVRDLLPSRRSDPVIRLVGVTHLGSSNYYASLQTLLDRERLVLFEGVGATNKDFRSTRDGAYSLQPALARALGLRFQLHAIDYSGDHFVNSDLSVAQLQRVIAGPTSTNTLDDSYAVVTDGDGERTTGDESLDNLLSIMDGSSFLGVVVKFGIAFIETNPRLRTTVRLVLVETLGSLEGDLGEAKGLPPELRRLMDLLIRERNNAVLQDVKRAIDKGRARRRDRLPSLAIFYGAGHLADLERRLCADFGYHPGPDQWFTAFDANPRSAGLTDAEVSMVRRMVREQLKSMGVRK